MVRPGTGKPTGGTYQPQAAGEEVCRKWNKGSHDAGSGMHAQVCVARRETELASSGPYFSGREVHSI